MSSSITNIYNDLVCESITGISLQSWLGWEYKPFVAKTVSCRHHPSDGWKHYVMILNDLQGSGSSIWYNNGTMNMQVVDVRNNLTLGLVIH